MRGRGSSAAAADAARRTRRRRCRGLLSQAVSAVSPGHMAAAFRPPASGVASRPAGYRPGWLPGGLRSSKRENAPELSGPNAFSSISLWVALSSMVSRPSDQRVRVKGQRRRALAFAPTLAHQAGQHHPQEGVAGGLHTSTRWRSPAPQHRDAAVVVILQHQVCGPDRLGLRVIAPGCVRAQRQHQHYAEHGQADHGDRNRYAAGQPARWRVVVRGRHTAPSAHRRGTPGHLLVLDDVPVRVDRW